jgi:hypothetical protein
MERNKMWQKRRKKDNIGREEEWKECKNTTKKRSMIK